LAKYLAQVPAILPNGLKSKQSKGA